LIINSSFELYLNWVHICRNNAWRQ
jgi:hypothetical protein